MYSMHYILILLQETFGKHDVNCAIRLKQKWRRVALINKKLSAWGELLYSRIETEIY